MSLNLLCTLIVYLSFQHINSTSVLDAPVIDPNYFDYTFGLLISIAEYLQTVNSMFADRRVLSLGLDVAVRTAAISPLADLIESVANPQNFTTELGLDRYDGIRIQFKAGMISRLFEQLCYANHGGRLISRFFF